MGPAVRLAVCSLLPTSAAAAPKDRACSLGSQPGGWAMRTAGLTGVWGYLSPPHFLGSCQGSSRGMAGQELLWRDAAKAGRLGGAVRNGTLG